MKRIFKICLLVTVVSLIGALALLPFAVNGMVNQLDKWAEYSAYQVDYERSAEGIANMEVKFEGIERIYCAVEVGNYGTDGLRLSTDGLQIGATWCGLAMARLRLRRPSRCRPAWR